MQTLKRTILSGFVLAALAAATPAFATGFNANFVVTINAGPDAGTYTFSLPDSLTGAANVGSDYFDVPGVEMSKNGGAPQLETVYFAEDQPLGNGDGGLATFSGAYVFSVINPNQLTGLALFTGTLSDPTFVAGVYQVEDQSHTADKGTVTIYTPEPGTLVLFGMGLLFLAGLMRRKLRLPQAGRLVLR